MMRGVSMKIKIVFLSVLTFFITLLISQIDAQASQDLQKVDVEKIIGANDLIAVNAEASNIPFKFKNLVNAFGRVAVGCTATHLGKGYVLTAGHCFYAPPTAIKDQPCSSEYDVQWGIREGQQPYLTSKCTRLIIAQRNNKTDYALFKVDPIPDVAVRPDLSEKPEVGDRITIFSHPDELPLRWSKICRVKRLYSTSKPVDSLFYYCDTNPGSSGASVIDVNSLKVIGVHDGGQILNVTDNDLGVGFNYGTYIYETPLLEIMRKLDL